MAVMMQVHGTWQIFRESPLARHARLVIITLEVRMGRFGKAISVGLVWLAAGSTLLAGVPVSACRCLAGDTQTTSDRKKSDTPASCCGTGCCSTSNGSCCPCRASHAETAAHKSCCANRDSGNRPPSGVPTLSGTCCVRTTYQPDAALSTPETARTARTHAASQPLMLFAPTVVARGAPVSATAVNAAPGHSLAPPPNLISLLQHLLI
jgi:hypothetical protein